MLRCPLCANWQHTQIDKAFIRCNLCALAFQRDGGALPKLDFFRSANGCYYFQSWNSWLTRIRGGCRIDRLPSFGFTPVTVRMFATRDGRIAKRVDSSVPLLPLYAHWTHGTTIRADISRPVVTVASGADKRLTLGIIASEAMAQEAQALCVQFVRYVSNAVIVLDTADEKKAANLQHSILKDIAEIGPMKARVIARQLQGDFAEQRNVIQRNADTEWIIQLDCDENLNVPAQGNLSGIIDLAEADHLDVVALPRRNYVDGQLSALYPDVQYRLLRRSIRFTRSVHEYPSLGRGQRSFVYLGASIDHQIAGERLARREVVYEAMQATAGRSHDTALLRLPLDTNVELSG